MQQAGFHRTLLWFHWDEHEDLTAVEGRNMKIWEEEMENAPKDEQGESPPEVSPEEQRFKLTTPHKTTNRQKQRGV